MEQDELIPLGIYGVMSCLEKICFIWFFSSAFLIYRAFKVRNCQVNYHITRLAYVLWSILALTNCFFDIYLTLFLLTPYLRLVSNIQVVQNSNDTVHQTYNNRSDNWCSGDFDNFTVDPFGITDESNNTVSTKALVVYNKLTFPFFVIFGISLRFLVMFLMNFVFAIILLVAAFGPIWNKPRDGELNPDFPTTTCQCEN